MVFIGMWTYYCFKSQLSSGTNLVQHFFLQTLTSAATKFFNVVNNEANVNTSVTGKSDTQLNEKNQPDRKKSHSFCSNKVHPLQKTVLNEMCLDYKTFNTFSVLNVCIFHLSHMIHRHSSIYVYLHTRIIIFYLFRYFSFDTIV